MSKFVCPYCMQDYAKKEVLYTCPDCGRPSQLKMFEKTAKCKHSNCSGWATLRRCPRCEHEIPKAVLETENLPFSIIGVPNSGKTNYITVMLQELKKSAGLRLSLSHQDRTTKDHQNMHFKMIYEDLIPPPNTSAGEPMPQIWSIKNLEKMGRNSVPTYTFTIFDGAGEDHKNNINQDSPVARYINMSEAIIFVLDPLTISNIRTEGLVDEETMQNSLGGSMGESADASDTINDIANYIREMNPRKYKPGDPIKIPVAVVMSKFDTVWNHPSFGDSPTVREEGYSISGGKVDMSKINQADGEVKSWLEDIGEYDLLKALDANFPDHKFFGVSSYGEPPKDAGTLNKPNPRRVLDPLLWLFRGKKFLD